jgi:curved DNA-binding protein CbpA
MNYYAQIEVTPDADVETIKKALGSQSVAWSKRASMAVSQDKRHEAERMVTQLSEIRAVLLDDEKRRQYDEVISAFPMLPQDLSTVGVAPERVPCPACRELILHDARKCRWCGEWLDVATSAPNLVVPPNRDAEIVLETKRKQLSEPAKQVADKVSITRQSSLGKSGFQPRTDAGKPAVNASIGRRSVGPVEASESFAAQEVTLKHALVTMGVLLALCLMLATCSGH